MSEHRVSDEELDELIRRWKKMSAAPIDIRLVSGPAVLDTAIPLLIELRQLRDALKEEEEDTSEDWTDAEDEWSDAIKEAFPTRSGSHHEYGKAMKMVSNRYSKGSLVALVNWLLVGGAAPGCPCLLIEPCSKQCSCAHPGMSGGCGRCARYGSTGQRIAAAKRLAGLVDPPDDDADYRELVTKSLEKDDLEEDLGKRAEKFLLEYLTFEGSMGEGQLYKELRKDLTSLLIDVYNSASQGKRE